MRLLVKKNKLSIIFVSLIILFLPYLSAINEYFEDLINYQIILEKYSSTQFEINSLLRLLFGELAFTKILFFLYIFLPKFQILFFSISTLSLAIFSWFLLKRRINYLVVFLLLSPLVFGFFGAQIRNALALSIFLLGLVYSKKYFRYICFLLSVSIHLSMLVLVGVYFFQKIVDKKIKNNNFKLILFISLGALISFSTVIFYFLIGLLTKAFIYQEGLGMSPTLFIWTLGLLIGLVYKRHKNSVIINTVFLDYSIIGISIVVFCFFSGGYYSRFLVIFYPFILLSIPNFSLKDPVLLLMIFYCIYSITYSYLL